MLYIYLLIYSISSKRTFIAVCDLGGPLKKSSETSQFRFIFPTTPRLKSPPPGIKSPPPGRPHKSNSPVPGHTKQANAGGLPEGGGGGECWSIDLIGKLRYTSWKQGASESFQNVSLKFSLIGYHEGINSSRLEKLALPVYELNWREQGWKCEERVENSASYSKVDYFS